MSYSISTSPRTGRGKGFSRKLRTTGVVPAVIYGHGIAESKSVALDPSALLKALEAPKGFNTLFDVKLGDDTFQCFVRELQRHPVSRAILHCDLVSPDLNKPTLAEVPIETTGKSIGVTTGGKLSVPYRTLRVLAKPQDVPEKIVVDITNLDHNDVVKASELDLPDGVSPVFERDYVAVKISAPRGKKTEEETDEE